MGGASGDPAGNPALGNQGSQLAQLGAGGGYPGTPNRGGWGGLSGMRDPIQQRRQQSFGPSRPFAGYPSQGRPQFGGGYNPIQQMMRQQPRSMQSPAGGFGGYGGGYAPSPYSSGYSRQQMPQYGGYGGGYAPSPYSGGYGGGYGQQRMPQYGGYGQQRMPQYGGYGRGTNYSAIGRPQFGGGYGGEWGGGGGGWGQQRMPRVSGLYGGYGGRNAASNPVWDPGPGVTTPLPTETLKMADLPTPAVKPTPVPTPTPAVAPTPTAQSMPNPNTDMFTLASGMQAPAWTNTQPVASGTQAPAWTSLAAPRWAQGLGFNDGGLVRGYQHGGPLESSSIIRQMMSNAGPTRRGM